MNNDLISRSALKEAIRKRLGISSLKYLTEQERVVVNEIDNATTIPQTIITEFKGCDNCELDRAKGEWIECTKSGMPLTEYGRMVGEKWYGFKCSRCNFIYKGNALIESPFCQKCGADMQKGGAE